MIHALSLLAQGAGGNTFEELRAGLNLSNDSATTADQFNEFHDLVQTNAGDSILSIANRIYTQHDLQLKKDFQEVAISKFKSDVQSLDFNESEKSAAVINYFVEEKTNGKIKDLIKPEQISPNTRLILMNAIYFKGKWEVPFYEFLTSPGNFFVSDTERVSVPFMTTKSNFNYAYIEELNAEVLEMKYANSNFAFLIVLPNEYNGLPELETKLTTFELSRIVEQMTSSEPVDILIPKFEIEYEIELTHVLSNVSLLNQS